MKGIFLGSTILMCLNVGIVGLQSVVEFGRCSDILFGQCWVFPGIFYWWKESLYAFWRLDQKSLSRDYSELVKSVWPGTVSVGMDGTKSGTILFFSLLGCN